MQPGSWQLEAFECDGFLVVPGVFSREEADALVAECNRLACIQADRAPIIVVADGAILDASRARKKRRGEMTGIG